MCVYFFYVLVVFWSLWFRHYKMAQDTSEDYFLNVVEVGRAPAGDLFFPSQPSTATPWRGAHTKEWWKGGRDGGRARRREVRGQGQMSWIQREKHIAFHQPAEKEVIHNSVDTIQPWMLGVRCTHAATGRQVKKRKKYHFPPQLFNSSRENKRLRLSGDWRKKNTQKR